MTVSTFITSTWSNTHVGKIRSRAGNRYTPELNVELPISKIFDYATRSNSFYLEIRSQHGKFSREFKRISTKFDNKEIQEEYKLLANSVVALSDQLMLVKKYSKKEIPWRKIQRHSQKARSRVWPLMKLLRNQKENPTNESLEGQTHPRLTSQKDYDSDIHHLYKLNSELRFFEDLSTSEKARLSNTPFLLLTGDAGAGKTHLLCDVVEQRLLQQPTAPAVLSFGELYKSGTTLTGQLVRQLGITMPKREFLRQLNRAGRESKCRALLVIDALNEAPETMYWKKNISQLIDEIKQYPHIALIVSVRTGFEDEVMFRKQKMKFVEVAHHGFEFREWEAVSKFFQEFNLPVPEIPLLLPEFQNPLFLLLFCKAFEARERKNVKKSVEKQIFRGHEGATYIFEAFVDNVSKKIAREFGISNNPSENIWDTVIEKIAEKMVDENTDRISESAITEIVAASHPSVDYNELIQALDRNMLLVKVPEYSVNDSGIYGYNFRFPFQKFSDHLLGRFIFKKFELEFGKSNKNVITAKNFFSRRRALGKYLSESWNIGLVEALSIQCPEHLKGAEFVDVAPYLRRSIASKEAFIKSIVWRKPSAFSADLRNTLDFINTEIINNDTYHSNLIDSFLAVSLVPGHPLNADFLHTHLEKNSMPNRDSWWSTFLHYQYGARGSVDRLLEWGWSSTDKSNISDEAIYLYGTALSWFLTTPNRFVRDKATKALVSILTNRLAVVLKILQRFHKVNDPYVTERLYAAAYGCAIRSHTDKAALKALAEWIYNNFFKAENPPAHILIRDYAKSIIEVALHKNAISRISRLKIEPPYRSSWPKRVPTDGYLKRKYYPNDYLKSKSENRGFLEIWSSVMYNSSTMGDFGNYVLNSAINHWSGRNIRNPEPNRSEVYKKFRNNLTINQRKLLDLVIPNSYRNRYQSVSQADLDALLESLNGKENKVTNLSNYLVRNRTTYESQLLKLLPPSKKLFYKKEIAPFIADNRSIVDPLDYFDHSRAQRWVFNKVVQLGWDSQLHGQFDKELVSHDRSEHKAERIGKKYQWIALYELLARVADNFQFRGETWVDKEPRYEGTWQLSIRNIDPTCLLKTETTIPPKTLPNIQSGHISNAYSNWARSSSDIKWLSNSLDLPDPTKMIETRDSEGKTWLSLRSHMDWKDEVPPELEEFNVPTRRLWYSVKSYLVKTKDLAKTIKWAEKQNFMGRWMPESHSFYNVFLGEYPWAKAFLYHNVPYYHHDAWTDGSSMNDKLPSKVLVTDDEYRSSGSSIDCSQEEIVSTILPSKFIVDRINLSQPRIDGQYFDTDGNLVAFDMGAFDKDAVEQLLVNKELFLRFLNKKGLSIFWTLLGEKQLIGGNFASKAPGHLEINGAYTLSKKTRVSGSKSSSYIKHPY